MKQVVLVPNFVSSLRIAALPLFFYLFNTANITACLILLSFCAATDFLDGYIARRMHSNSRFGAYYDATTDFALMFGIYTLFTFRGLYPTWFIFLIFAAFGQFVVTSIIAKKFYDPIGKYLGSALSIGVALTLLVPSEATFLFVQYAFSVFFLVSLTSRIISLIRKPAKTYPS